MLYLQRAATPPLDAFIASIWYCESEPRPHALERVLPNGAAQLIVNLKEDRTRVYRPESGTSRETTSSGAVLSGVQSRYCVIDTAEQESVLGVVFRPGGAIPFFRMPAHETRDAHVPLDVFWGRRAAALRDQLMDTPNPNAKLDTMERALREIFRPSTVHPAVACALDEFAHRPHAANVSAVTSMTGLSPKRFIERFKAAVGVAPKQYCRILRFQQALAHAENGRRVDWTRIAMDSGYFDQAHFIHDFRSFAGLTPTGYQADRTQFRNHVKFLQSDAVSA